MASDQRLAPAGAQPGLDVVHAAALTSDDVLRQLGSARGGLSVAQAADRLAELGPNAVRSDEARWLPVLVRQVRSPLLVLLVVAAVASYFVGERTSAVIIGAILVVSVGLGFVNEYRAVRAAEALHGQIRHTCVVVRGGHPASVDVTALVPGDVVDLQLGAIVPADLRLLDVAELECDESILTGESMPVAKSVEPTAPGAALAELTGAALMGTVVHAGSGTGVVVATGSRAEFGRIAQGLSEGEPETEFQAGLRQFSVLLVQVAAVLTVSIFAINLLLHRPLLEALLFSLAIAVGITPQLLPAVVSTSLAAGSQRLAQRKVLVKRLVCIEDLGNIQVLFTDKTGTLTDGQISLTRSIGTDGRPDDDPLRLGLLCTEIVGDESQPAAGNALDVAMWDAPAAAPLRDAAAHVRRLALLPFDHERRLVSVLVEQPDGTRTLVSKGAPEGLLSRCTALPAEAQAVLDAEFDAGSRVVAIATRAMAGRDSLGPADERDLELRGFLVFKDAPKASAVDALSRLAGLGLTVKVVTGDNARVAAKVCRDLGLPTGPVVTGADLDETDDADLPALVAGAAIFARVSPEHKARIVRAQRRTGVDVAFLGDGVNDAVALHAADVGISVDSAADVAKDAADVILLAKDLHVLADGVLEGRRIFANTIKYVLMGTSSNFGNMFSAAGASALLTFLPMLPSQILLNNLLYDTSQLAIPTDHVDPEQLARPAAWDIRFIRRFMLFFGPISSLFDFATFAIMIGVFHAGPAQFRSGWFVESLATQTLVIFAVRTRRVPFFRSRPSVPLLASALGIVVIGTLIPSMPFASTLGFGALPAGFFLVLVLLAACYLVLIELGKRWFYRAAPAVPARTTVGARERRIGYRILRRARRFTSAGGNG
ncbi:MAG TPA: magnesium-translocating P-type ATPase [Cellulomonas sp.]